MSTIGRLFGKSPFGLLQRHMQQVGRCVDTLQKALLALEDEDATALDQLAAEVSQQEHEADRIKDDIRVHLRNWLFLPVDRNRVLEVLSIQDHLADVAEDVCVLMTLKPLRMPEGVGDAFKNFADTNVQAFAGARSIVDSLDELVESGFGGAEAERMRHMADDVAAVEHRADVIQADLLKKILAVDTQLSHGEFYLWMRLIRELAGLSNGAENLARRIQTALELK